MAIAFRAVGARTKADVSVTGSPQTVAMPAGHTTNDFLIMVILNDDNTGPSSTPAGWTQLIETSPGTSSASPYVARPRTSVFYRIDTGALGSSVSVDFNTASFPTGDPYVLAFIAAYSGCDTASPIGEWGNNNTTATTAALAHPQITTTLANDWLLTLRTVSSDSPAATFTDSVGTDSERVDDNTGNEVAFALYDSNAALSSGLQTQRTTTASRIATYGSVMMTIAIRPAAVAGTAVALAGVAAAAATAYTESVNATSGPWDLCSAGGIPVYTVAVDWNADGDFSDSDEDITGDVIGDTNIVYGRDQDRQLSPGAIGSASLSVINVDRKYSPEMVTSSLYGDLDPARDTRMQVTYGGSTFPLFRGRIDDYDVHVDRTDRTVSFSFLDGLSLLQGFKLSTGVYESFRTGEIVDTILDLAGWTGGRDIDLGGTIVKFWWAEGVDALSAIQDIVKSEGPPSIGYVGPDGTFVFRDRHHRLLRSTSLNSQGTFAAAAIGCASPASTGFDFTAPFVYAHGWRDIINSVSFDVTERAASTAITEVWTSEDSYALSAGQSVDIDISGSDPFRDAITPVSGTDFTTAGAGTVQAVLSRTSGQSVKITLTAVGGSVTVTSLKLRARSIPVRRTLKISATDAGSITKHGERAYPDSAPWANANDAGAIANVILLHYAQRQPTVQLRVTTQDPNHFIQVISRTISDRIRITNAEMGLDDDFFVERVTHTIQRMNRVGHPPVHSVVLGCEKDLGLVNNPFTFDKRGAGFDDGVFDPIASDDAELVFIFDDSVQGAFDTGLFGT